MSLRRRVMQAAQHSSSDTDGYITDGLVMYLKGDDAQNGLWVDRINRIVFDLFNCSASSDGMGVVFNGTAYGESRTAPLPTSGPFQIEVVAGRNTASDGSVMVCLPFRSNEITPLLGFHTTDAGVMYRNGSHDSSFKLRPFAFGNYKQRPIYASLNAEYGYRNGAQLSTQSWSDWFEVNAHQQKITVSGRHNVTDGTISSYIKGTIYAVRIYSRQLTAEEVSQNYAIDRNLYGGVAT